MAWDMQVGDRQFDFATIQGLKSLREWAETKPNAALLNRMLRDGKLESTANLLAEVRGLLAEETMTDSIRSTLVDLRSNLLESPDSPLVIV